MGETVRRVLADNPALAAGRRVCDQRSLSRRLAPARRDGGHARSRSAAGRLLFFTASRAHHAEIGGIVPGSMPPFSQNLAEEGVLIRNFKLVDAGQPRLDELRRAARFRPVSRRRNVARQPGRHHRPGRRQSARRPRSATAGRALFAGRSSRPTCDTSSRRPSEKMRPAWPACPAAASVRRSPGRRLADRRGDRDRRRPGGDRLHRHRPGAGGQSERQPRDRHGGRDVLPALLIDEDIPLNQGVLGPVRSCCPSAC